jgi:hypothetical protein
MHFDSVFARLLSNQNDYLSALQGSGKAYFGQFVPVGRENRHHRIDALLIQRESQILVRFELKPVGVFVAPAQNLLYWNAPF